MPDIPWTPEPWLPFLATEYIRSLKPGSVFEWGSGGSTLFFISLGVSGLVSVEHDPAWFEAIRQELARRNLRPGEYHLVPYETGEIGPDKAEPEHYKSGSTELGPVNFKRYASFIDSYEPFDLVLVDGMARAACLKHAVGKVKPGGWLVLDNSDRGYYLEKTGPLFEGWERITFYGYGPILAYMWQTTFLRKPGG